MPIIYSFTDKKTNKLIYIGSTIRDKKIREKEHNTSLNLYLHEYVLQNGGWENIRFDIVECISCSLQELHLIERAYIDKLNPICNKRKPSATQEERDYQIWKFSLNINTRQEELECLSAIKC